MTKEASLGSMGQALFQKTMDFQEKTLGLEFWGGFTGSLPMSFPQHVNRVSLDQDGAPPGWLVNLVSLSSHGSGHSGSLTTTQFVCFLPGTETWIPGRSLMSLHH